MIWITQALRQIDLLTSKGQTILIFFMMTGLVLPSLVAIIAPVALFAGILYTLNKLNGDSELVVMAAAGVSPGPLLRPLALFSVAVFAIVAAVYIQVLPWSFGVIENLTTFIQADFISNFARPGAFSNLDLASSSITESVRLTALFRACSCRTAGTPRMYRPTLPKPARPSRRMGRAIFSCPMGFSFGPNRRATRPW